MQHNAFSDSSRQTAREKQMMSHLLRLDDLHKEHLALTQKRAHYRIDRDRSLILTEKHRDAESQIIALSHRLLQLVSTQESAKRANELELSPLAAARAAATMVDFDFDQNETARVKLLHATFTAFGVDPSESPVVLSSLAGWLQTNYSARYIHDVLPLASTLAVTRCELACENEWKKDREKQLKEYDEKLDLCERSKEERRTQLISARQRLHNAQRSVFDLRKRLFNLHEWITGRQPLPTGERLDPIMCSEVLRRIRSDIAIGDLDFTLLLSANGGQPLRDLVQRGEPYIP